MAIFYPTIEKIKTLNVHPEPGELALLVFLEQILDDNYEVYFNPYMNGDRPDVVVMRKGGGVLIIEVKDWNLDAYDLNEKKQWKEKKGVNIVKSPISQVLKYKDNLFNLHIGKLLPLKIANIKNFNIVTCAIYFHNANRAAISAKLVNPYIDDRKYMNFLKYNIDLLGYDDLSAETFNKLLYNRWISRSSIYFTNEIYENIREFMQPTIHMLNDGVDVKYTDKQRSIIHSTTKVQRVKGVMGSGKTTVLAARAVYGYKRALETNPNAKVLILTYNITLKNFIHDKINRVREEFPWSVFVINNYHQLLKSEFNNLGIEIEIPNGCNDPAYYVDKYYYSNPAIFNNVKDKISKYDVILIDEIQDYRRVWMDIIKNNFLTENGEYVLFGDVKQNIYGNITEYKDVSTNVKGKPTELTICFRSDFKVRDLAIEFQKSIFKDKYEIDDFNKKSGMLSLEFEKEGYLNYMYLDNVDTVASIFAIVTGNVVNKKEHIARNDITVLGYNINDLQRFDSYYRYLTNEKTMTMFASQELIYLHSLNFKPQYNWMFTLLRGKGRVDDANKNTAILFVIYDLYCQNKERFEAVLKRKCSMLGITLDYFVNWMSQHDKEYCQFKEGVHNVDRKVLDRNKKLHFWMNSGCMKISTIHSFKGWESKVVFLILDKISDGKSTFDELLYTGITRCCSNLIVLNYGNKEYDAKIRPLIEKVKG